MITHTFRRGHRTRIPLVADSVQSAVINGRDIADIFNADASAFLLDFADTEDLTSGLLVISHTTDGKSVNSQISLEAH